MINQVMSMQTINSVLSLKDSIKIKQMNQDISGLMYEVSALKQKIVLQNDKDHQCKS